MAIDTTPFTNDAGDNLLPDSPNAYPSLFRKYVLHSVENALAGCRAGGLTLSDDLRGRSLHALSFALKLPDCWAQTSALLFALAPAMELQGVGNEWTDFLRKGAERAEAAADWTSMALVYVYMARLNLIVGEQALAEEQLHHALHYAERVDDPSITATVMERLAYCAAVRSDFEQARQTAQAALDLLPDDSDGCVPIYHTLGYVALREGRVQTAVEHFNMALTTRKSEPVPLFEAQALSLCGIALLSSGNHAAAAAHMREAIRCFGLAGDSFNQAAARMNLGTVYQSMGRCSESLECYHLSEPVFVKANSSVQLARLHHNRSLALHGLGRHDDARRSSIKSLHWAQKNEQGAEATLDPERFREIYAQPHPGADVGAGQREPLTELDKLPERPAHLHKEMVRKFNEVAAPDEFYHTAWPLPEPE
jgi:tetratricopeptide (TPR) repeat protein